MSLAAFEDFFYGACLLDWDAEGERDAPATRALRRGRRGPDRRRRRPICTLSLARPQRRGRRRPHEHARRGVLLRAGRGLGRGDDPSSTSRPISRARRVEGIRLDVPRAAGSRRHRPSRARTSSSPRSTATRARGSSASSGSAATPGITQPMRNILFDEKMAGTIHLALGAELPARSAARTRARCTGT